MSGSFVQRAIDVTFTRATGVFAEGGKNTLTLSGLRCSAVITKNGGASWGALDLRVYGMTLSTMNDLSTLGMLVTTDQKNSVSVFAGNVGSALGLVFEGTIYQAWTDFRQMPEVPFVVSGQTGLTAAVTPVAPSSYTGAADVAVIMASLATQMGLAFQNSGVSGVVLSNSYLSGTALQQAKNVAQHAGINLDIDANTLYIWPKNGSKGGAVPLISPSTGLIGYPTYTANGIDIEVLYNPSITFGGKVQVQSSLPQACGTWQVYGLTHDLESITPGGAWKSSVRLVSPQYAASNGA
jgi:hypothetical protein